MVAPDSKRWAIASRAKKTWAAPNYIVRVDLASGQLISDLIAPANDLDCVAFIPERGFLVLSANGPGRVEYFLVLPASGLARKRRILTLSLPEDSPTAAHWKSR